MMVPTRFGVTKRWIEKKVHVKYKMANDTIIVDCTSSKSLICIPTELVPDGAHSLHDYKAMQQENALPSVEEVTEGVSCTGRRFLSAW